MLQNGGEKPWVYFAGPEGRHFSLDFWLFLQRDASNWLGYLSFYLFFTETVQI